MRSENSFKRYRVYLRRLQEIPTLKYVVNS